eukprot:COSAG01_NODE_184_length_22692_cov_155.762758_6_plen_154_part_00
MGCTYQLPSDGIALCREPAPATENVTALAWHRAVRSLHCYAATGAGEDNGIDHSKNRLRFPYDSTFLRSHYLRPHPYHGCGASTRKQLKQTALVEQVLHFPIAGAVQMQAVYEQMSERARRLAGHEVSLARSLARSPSLLFWEAPPGPACSSI